MRGQGVEEDRWEGVWKGRWGISLELMVLIKGVNESDTEMQHPGQHPESLVFQGSKPAGVW